MQQEEEIEGEPIDYKRLQRYRYIDSVCQATVKSHLDPYWNKLMVQKHLWDDGGTLNAN